MDGTFISDWVSALYKENKYIEPYLKLYERTPKENGMPVDIADLNIQLSNKDKEFKGWKYTIGCLFKYLIGYKPCKDKKFWVLLGKKQVHMPINLHTFVNKAALQR